MQDELMDVTFKPRVTATPPARSVDAHERFQSKLAYETDPADVYADMAHGLDDFVLVDVRSPSDYKKSHAVGAINIPVGQITERRMAEYPEDTLFVVYCWGPGCNGATKAAMKLSGMGYAAKEMIGGIEYWEDRERHPVERHRDR